MPLPMARPVKIKDSPNRQYVARIPRDVLDKARGQTVAVEIDGRQVSFRIGPNAQVVKFSLRTSDQTLARSRHRAVAEYMSNWFDALRTGVTTLTHRQTVALAGELYRDIVAAAADEPLTAEDTGRPVGLAVAIYRDIIAAFTDEPMIADGTMLTPDMYDNIGEFITGENPYGAVLDLSDLADDLLARRGLTLDPASRKKVVEQFNQAFLLAAGRLKQNALGDYSPDQNAARWPSFEAGKLSTAVPFDSLIDGWVKEAKPVQSTVDQWRVYFRDLEETTGITDASKLTADHVIKWKDALLERGGAMKTINDSKLAALSRVLTWAVENRKLTANVAKGIRVRQKRKPGKKKMLGYSDEQASIILTAASASTTPAYRWLPWLCALHGCRAGEVSQMRKADVRKDRSGIHYMHLTPEAGSMKNEGSERDVPLHPHLIKIGFLSFVEGHKDGPLFFDPSKRRKSDAKKPQSKIVNKNVAAWIKELGVEGVGRAHRVDPSHAWRHRFKTECRRHEIQDSVIDAIQGHAPRTEGQAYGDVTLTTKLEAVKKVSVPALNTPGDIGD
jgi:integrase